MANDFSMSDIGSLYGTSADSIIKNSTSRKGNTELNMEDFLQLMIVQLTSQTIDDTMDTSEMMNQMVQMQMVNALANMTDASVQSYASSLVGKVVTVGVMHDNVLEEREIVVMGTGSYNGQRVIFGSDGTMYYLSQIMAVGYLPDENGNYTVGGSGGTGGDDVEESYIYTDDDGKETTVYVGEDGKAGTEDDWYYAEVEGKKEKVFVGPDGVPGTKDDVVYNGTQGAPNEDDE